MRYIALIALLIVAIAGGGCAAHNKSNSVTLTADGKRDTAVAKEENAKAYDLILKGKYDEAEAACRRAIEADVMFGPPHNNLGLIYYHQDKLYPAAWEFQNAIKLMPYVPE